MTHMDYEKVKSELFKKQDFIVDQIDAVKVLSLLQDIKEFDFDKSVRKFSASLNSEVLFDEIVTHFPIGSRITGEEKSYALPNGNEPDLIFDYKPKIKEEDKKYLIKNCLVFLNQHSCLNFQFVTNHDDYNFITICHCFAFSSLDGYKISSKDSYDQKMEVSIYEDTNLGRSYPIIFKTNMDYSEDNDKPASEVVNTISFDELVEFISKKFKINRPRVRGKKTR